MKNRMPLILSLTVSLIALAAHAEVYKCRQPNGSTEFSNTPCSGGSSTVKTLPDDVVPEANRLRAERNAERLREEARWLEDSRRAEKLAERESLEKTQKQTKQGEPTVSAIDDCLRSIERMAIDSIQRSELEARCRHSGTLPPPVYVPVPYYAGPGYRGPAVVPPRPFPVPNNKVNLEPVSKGTQLPPKGAGKIEFDTANKFR